MANRVTIDVEARFVDQVSSGMNSAAKSADKLEKSVKEANKELDKVSKKKVKPQLGADDNPFTKKLRSAQSKLEKLGKTKAAATLGAIDKASAKIGQVTGAARAFAGKTFKGALSMADKASNVIGSVTGAAKSFAGKTYSAAVKIIDYATTPLRKIKESLFSIKSLIAAITAGFAAKQFIMNPINLADQYSSAQIGFSTLLGADGGQKMMDDIDEFAKATPFKTSNVISNVQKMMAYGWDADKVIKDMETIGDAAAATGKGDQGLESIVYALSEIRSKGKLSAQELNQLASAGIKAKQYLAQGLGYGTDDAGMAKLMEDLEDGAVGANQAIELILKGMEEFDGMMDKTANETVEGLWSQIEDTFEINIFRRWGQGLQDGAKKGLGSIVDLLNSSEGALEDFGELVYDIGKELSNWTADKLENVVETVKEITQTDAFKNASLGGKIKILWDEIIAEPFSDWWNSKGKKWLAEKAQRFGEGLGSGISKGFLALLGVDVSGIAEDGISIGSSFAKGFAEGFDGSAVTDAIVDAISNVWKALPTWAKILIGGYGAGKIAGGVNSIISLGSTLIGGASKVLGSAATGTGILGKGALTAINLGAGNLAGGASMSAGALSAIGLGATAGGIAAGVSGVKGITDLYKSYKAYKAGDKTEGKANLASGANTLSGLATGAAIGSIFGPVGTLIGAGIGGVAGWIGGNWKSDQIREDAAKIEAAKYSSEKMREAVMNTELSAEELQAVFEEACWDDMVSRFGNIELSMAEIEKLANGVVFDGATESIEKFSKATEQAKKSVSSFENAAADMDRLGFDMQEHLWKVNMGIDEKLSESEIEEVKARVQNYIASAEQVLSDQHYQFNAAVEVLLQPKEGEDNSTYNSIIESGNGLFAKLQKELDGYTADLEAKYNLFLKDGKITADEQKILDELQTKINEIVQKVSNAETEATFQVAKMKFTTGDLSAESFVEFQKTLQTQMEQYIAEQDEALTVSLTNLNLQLAEKEITQDEYDEKFKALLKGYNTNIDSMTAKVEQIQLEGIAEAFDGVGTVDELQSAIDELLASGENPLDVTFEDINAHLDIGENVLSEEAKANFTGVMQQALQSAATGDNALTVGAEVAAELNVNEEKLTEQNAELQNYLKSQLEGGEEGSNTITPEIPVEPKITMEEGEGENLKSTLESQLSPYLTGNNALTTTADVYAKGAMYGSGGRPLSEEASAGRSTVQGAVDTAFTDPFSASADANITLNWKISNPTTTLSFSGGGGSGSTVTATVGGNAKGGFISGGPQLSWLDEEGTGEVVIPFNPSRRARALALYAETGRRLGITNHANGGFVGGDSTPIQPYDGEIKAGSGEQKIEVNMGGVVIEIKTDGSKPIAESIEDQQQEIAEKVAEIFRNTFKAQFANMPLRGGT